MSRLSCSRTVEDPGGVFGRFDPRAFLSFPSSSFSSGGRYEASCIGVLKAADRILLAAGRVEEEVAAEVVGGEDEDSDVEAFAEADFVSEMEVDVEVSPFSPFCFPAF